MKRRKGFGYDERGKEEAKQRGDRDLLGNETPTEAVLEFLGNTGIGTVKEGLVRDKI